MSRLDRMMLSYSELLQFKTYQDRLNYLLLTGVAPGEITFGPLRDLNQKFYRSRAWKKVRSDVIARDYGLDLGLPGHRIFGKVLVHHMNPITPKILYHSEELALDPEYLITVSNETHLAIHFGHFPLAFLEDLRHKGDTKLW